MQIGPQDATIDVPDQLKQMVMVVPVDTEEHKTQHIAQESGMSGWRAAKVGSWGTDSSSTMMVMMMARHATLKASMRPLLIYKLQVDMY
jgi:hypothetical protein